MLGQAIALRLKATFLTWGSTCPDVSLSQGRPAPTEDLSS